MGKVNTRKRGDYWEYYFEIASAAGKRKRKSKGGFKTKSEALKEGNSELNKYNNGGIVSNASEISFSDFLDLFLSKHCKNEMTLTTYAGYEKKIRLYIKPYIGEYRLKALTPVIIQDLLQEMKNKGYSKNTLIGIKTVLSSAFNYAVSPLQYIEHSPMAYVKIPKETMKQTKQHSKGGIRKDGKKNGAVVGSNKHVYIQKEWIDKIFNQFPEGHPDFIPLLSGYSLGCRIGEAYALTFNDFDFINKTVTINKQVQWNQEKQCWYIKNPKYDSVRTISVDDNFLQIIQRKMNQIRKDKFNYREFYTRYYVDDNNEINTNGIGKEIHFVNVREDGSYISPRTMQHCSKVIHYDLGFKDFDYHSLRHTHTTDLLKAGASPKFVQNRLGHKTIKVTLEIYQHLDEEQEKKESAILNKLYA